MSTDQQLSPTILGDWHLRTVGKWLGACAVGMILLGGTQTHAATVVTDTVISQAMQTQINVPVTFGQVFKDGDVPQNATVTASLNGQPVTLQVDAKATNPDGSLRHAVLTAMVPSLDSDAQTPLVLNAEPALPGGNRPITSAQVLATSYDAWVSLDIGGKTYKADARALLQAADTNNTCAPWGTECNVWLSGPLVSEWVVNGPVTTADGSSDPDLRIYFAVRAYAGATPGTLGNVRTDIIVENSSAFAPQAQPQYTATLTSGTATYTTPALTQYAYTRWHKVLWWNDAEPHVYLQQDTQYIQASKAVSRYMALTPDEKFLASLRQSCAPLDHCDQTQTMGDTGAQASIGPLPRWTSVYIVHPDARAYHWMLANTDALGAYSIHYRDHATGWPVSIQKHPYITIAAWAYANTIAKQSSAKGAAYKPDMLPGCVNNSVVTKCSTSWYGTGNPNSWDNAHQPAESYVPYMVTGDYYYMSELAFGASQNEIWPNEGYRGSYQGLIDSGHSQVRGKAWTLREMAHAAWLLPDSHPLKAEFTADVENSLADWNAKYTNNPDANPLSLLDDSVISDVNGGTRNGVSPWQHSFLTWSTGHAAELGFTGAAAFRDWLAKFEIGVMTDWQSDPTHGFCWLEATAYNVQVKDASKNWLPTYTAMYAATFPTLAGLTCNSPAMVAAMGNLEKQTWQAGEMHGYAYSATGFPANLQIGLASAADSGLPNAQAAWNVFDSRGVKPSGTNAYNNYPNFAVIPRPVEADTDTTPPTAPQPVTSAPPVTPPSPPPVKTAPPVRAPPSVAALPPPASVGNLFGSSGSAATTAPNAIAPGLAQSAVNEICNRVALFCAKVLPADWFSPAAQASGRPTPATSKAPVRVYPTQAASGVPLGLEHRATMAADSAAYPASAMVRIVLPPCGNTNGVLGLPVGKLGCQVSSTGIYLTPMK